MPIHPRHVNRNPVENTYLRGEDDGGGRELQFGHIERLVKQICRV